MNTRRRLTWVLAAAVLAFLVCKLRTSHFYCSVFVRSFRTADARLLLLAVLVIYSNNLFRALRWSIFLRPAYRASGLTPIPWYHLIGSQFLGFTGLALFGRIGELIRPLLVARRTGLSFPSQVAVVTVERVFDLSAFALIFTGNLLLSPNLRTLPYLHRAGFTIGGLTLALLIFVVAIRLAGTAVARAAKALVGIISKPAGAALAEKILSFRAGLNVIDSLADFGLIAFLSLALWGTIASCYVLVTKAFPAPVHTLTAAHTIVLMGFSIAGSALPIPGGSGSWAGNVFALTELFGIPKELAVSTGLMLWMILTLSIIPAGLLYARIEGISLGQVARRSEEAEDTTTS